MLPFTPWFNRLFARHEQCNAAPSAPDMDGDGIAVCRGNSIRPPVGKYETVPDKWFVSVWPSSSRWLRAQLNMYDWNAETNIERSFGGNSQKCPG